MYSDNLTLILILMVGLLIAFLLFIGLIISLTGRINSPGRRLDDDPPEDGIRPIPTTGGRPTIDPPGGHFHPDPLPQDDRPTVDPNPCDERGYGMD